MPDADTMNTTSSNTSSPLERLPFELRLKIYQAYLDSSNLEYKDQLLHDDILASLKPSVAVQSSKRWKATYYRESNEGIGFWSPFGFMSVTATGQHGTIGRFYIQGWAPPALWHVGGPLGAEARDYMLNERLRFAFTNLPHLGKSIARFEFWKDEQVKAGEAQRIRKVYMDVEYFDPEAPQKEEMVLEAGRRVLPGWDKLHDSRYPLFKVEIRDDGRVLRVSSLYKLDPKRSELVTTTLTIDAALGCGVLGSDRTHEFDGKDTLTVASLLLQTSKAFSAVEQTDRVDMGKPYMANEWLMAWQVCLGSEDVVGSKLKKTKASLADRLIRPLTYQYVVTELKSATT